MASAPGQQGPLGQLQEQQRLGTGLRQNQAFPACALISVFLGRKRSVSPCFAFVLQAQDQNDSGWSQSSWQEGHSKQDSRGQQCTNCTILYPYVVGGPASSKRPVPMMLSSKLQSFGRRCCCRGFGRSQHLSFRNFRLFRSTGSRAPCHSYSRKGGAVEPRRSPRH